MYKNILITGGSSQVAQYLKKKIPKNYNIYSPTKKDWDLICKHVFNVEAYGKHTCMFIDVDSQEIYRLTNDKYHLLKIVGND